MIEQDIYEKDGSYIIKKEINGECLVFGIFDNLEEAIEKRDELEEYGWPYDENTEDNSKIEKYIYEKDGRFIVSKKIKDVDIIFGNFNSLDKAKSFKRKLIENAWNVNFVSKPLIYGKYIQNINGNFTISKTFGDIKKSFGSFKSLDEAVFARDNLVDDNWGMDKSTILSNIGISELTGSDKNIGKVGKNYTVFHWENSKCTIFGFYNNYRLAVRVKDKLIDDWNADNFDYLENFQKKDTRYITRAGKSFRVNKSINGVLKTFGHYKTLDKAISVRDKLIKNNWDDSILEYKSQSKNVPDRYNHIHRNHRGFDVVNRIGGVLTNFGTFETLDEAISYRDDLEETNWVIKEEPISEEKFDEFIYLKEDGRYYLKNTIDEEVRIYGVFDNPLDAISMRLECIKNNWSFVSVLESEYLENPSMHVSFGSFYEDDLEEIAEDMLYSDIAKDILEFPVTVGKSYKNRGWAVKRSYLNDFIQYSDFEKECNFLVCGKEVSGKINIHTRLFYFTNEELSNYLRKLYDIDGKIQTRINLDLDYGNYKINNDPLERILKFETKFLKSFKKGLFAIPRSISQKLIPVLPYESNCKFLVNNIPAEGKFNLEFRMRFNDKELIEDLECNYGDGDDLEIIIYL